MQGAILAPLHIQHVVNRAKFEVELVCFGPTS